jgi:AAA15 family ATPase/GTPase
MKQANVEIKFINHDTIQVSMIELVNYLSSGTIKGINLFTDIEKILNSGGYLIIDEIENHLNKSILMNVIQFFLSSLNSHGATLIFSTHYSEIIDILPRTDMVYVSTKKNNLISTNKMSILLGNADRNSRKKSEILLSGTLDHTPTYRALKLVRKRLRENQPSSSESVEVN